MVIPRLKVKLLKINAADDNTEDADIEAMTVDLHFCIQPH